jgi:hypothetical protein
MVTFIEQEEENMCGEFIGSGMENLGLNLDCNKFPEQCKKVYDSLFQLISSPSALLNNLVNGNQFKNRKGEYWNDSNFSIPWKIGLLLQERLKITDNMIIRNMSCIPINNSILAVLTYEGFKRQLVYINNKGKMFKCSLDIPKLIDTTIFINQEIMLDTVKLSGEILSIGLNYKEWDHPSSPQGKMSELRIVWELNKTNPVINKIDMKEYFGGVGGCVSEMNCIKINRKFNPFSPMPNQRCIDRYKG